MIYYVVSQLKKVSASAGISTKSEGGFYDVVLIQPFFVHLLFISDSYKLRHRCVCEKSVWRE